MHIAVLTRVPSMEAEVIVEVLQAHGIPAVRQVQHGTHTMFLDGLGKRVAVEVPEESLEEARRILAEARDAGREMGG